MSVLRAFLPDEPSARDDTLKCTEADRAWWEEIARVCGLVLSLVGIVCPGRALGCVRRGVDGLHLGPTHGTPTVCQEALSHLLPLPPLSRSRRKGLAMRVRWQRDCPGRYFTYHLGRAWWVERVGEGGGWRWRDSLRPKFAPGSGCTADDAVAVGQSPVHPTRASATEALERYWQVIG